MHLNQRARARLLQAGSLVILLFAVLPSVTFVGHGPIEVAHTHAADHPQGAVPVQEDDSGDHASHCHEGMSKCGGQQSLVGSWWVGEDNGDLILDDPLRPVADTTETVSLLDPLTKILQPPRSSV